MPEPVAWLNGETVPISQARLSVFDLGVMQGVTVSEMLRTFRHQPFRLEAHLQRLENSLAHVGLTIPFSFDRLAAAVNDVCAHNARHIATDDDLGVALFVTAGYNANLAELAGIDGAPTGPTVCIHTFRLPFEKWLPSIAQGQRLVTTDHLPLPARAVHPHIKTRSRLHWYLADQEAHRRDPEAVALMGDGEGALLETSTANFLLVQDGRIRTPPHELTLPGISRAVVAELASELGFPFEFCRLTLNDVARATEAFTSSTLYCLLPVTRVDDVPVGSGQPGPVYNRLIEAWNRVAGLDIIGQVISRGSRQARPEPYRPTS